MSGKSNFKKLVLKLHEILGLSTGLVVFIVSITGCLWVFQEEIGALLSDEQTFEVQDAPLVTATRAKEIASDVFPGKNVHGALYGRPGEAVEVIFYEEKPEFYRSVYLHPYSGEIVKTEDHEAGFFHFVLEGHMHLWLPEEIGSEIVGVSVLLFLIILVSGLILWWPKKSNRRQRLKFSWKKSTGWKRKNFDLHAITGFYVYALAFIIAFTGCVMTYDWLHKSVYKTVGGDRYPFFTIPENIHSAPRQAVAAGIPMDRLVPLLQSENPNAVGIEIHYPHTDSSSIYVEISHQEGVYYSSDYRFFDQHTLAEIETPDLYGRYAEAGFAEKVIRMNYDIHVGAIGGLPGKIIAFLASLLTASLPVSGALYWYGKRFKKRKTHSTRSEYSNTLTP